MNFMQENLKIIQVPVRVCKLLDNMDVEHIHKQRQYIYFILSKKFKVTLPFLLYQLATHIDFTIKFFYFFLILKTFSNLCLKQSKKLYYLFYSFPMRFGCQTHQLVNVLCKFGIQSSLGRLSNISFANKNRNEIKSQRILGPMKCLQTLRSPLWDAYLFKGKLIKKS